MLALLCTQHRCSRVLGQTSPIAFQKPSGAGVEAAVPKIASGSAVTLNSYTLCPRAEQCAGCCAVLGAVGVGEAHSDDDPEG